MELSKLTRQGEIGVRAIYGSQNADLSDPQYDSRKVTNGSTFFAIRGLAQDGHSFINDALTRGATTIVLEDDSAVAEHTGATWVVVENARKALAVISEEAFGAPSSKLTLIGVTGTNGKTTTTNLVRQFCTLNGERVGLIGTLGVWIDNQFLEGTHTTPESRDLSALLARMVREGITTCVMEVSSHAIALDRVAALDFDIGIFTNITQDHLDFHQSFEAYAAAKQQFFTALKTTAIAITNADDPHGSFMVEHCDATAYSYGLHDGSAFGQADITADIEALTMHGSVFRVRKRYNDEHAMFRTQLVGKFNVQNVLAAASGLYFGSKGYSLEMLSQKAESLEPVRGRFEQISLPTKALAIVDYAHTPDALENLLNAVKTIDKDIRRIITVFGCGGDRDRTKRPIMGRIASELSNVAIITSDNPRTEDPLMIIDEIAAGIPKEKVAITMIEPDRKKAIEHALTLAGEHDIVLVAGKGHEDYQIVGNTKSHFDDKEIVFNWIKQSQE